MATQSQRNAPPSGQESPETETQQLLMAAAAQADAMGRRLAFFKDDQDRVVFVLYYRDARLPIDSIFDPTWRNHRSELRTGQTLEFKMPRHATALFHKLGLPVYRYD